MSYADYQIDLTVLEDAAQVTTTDGDLNPGYQPIIVRAVAAIVTTATTVGDTTINVIFRPTAGSATGEITLDTIVIPSGTAAGEVIFVDGLNQEIQPGEGLFISYTGVATSTGEFDVTAFVQPCWDNPGSNVNMTVSA